jgi:hypothetical protein
LKILYIYPPQDECSPHKTVLILNAQTKSK